MMVDSWVLGNAAGSLALFVCAHVCLFRHSKGVKIITWLVKAFALVAIINVCLSAATLYFPSAACTYSFNARIFALILSVGSYAIMAFSYVICLVGPYETSVRMRIVREIFGAPNSTITHQKLLQQYNNKIILDIRLQRMQASGDVALVGDRYQSKKTKSVFTFITSFSNFLKKCYGF